MYSFTLASSLSSSAPSGLSSLLAGPDLNVSQSLNQQLILFAPLTVEPTEPPTEPTPTPTAAEPPATTEPTPQPTVTVTQTAAPSEPQTVILDADQFGAGILGLALIVSFAAVSMVRGFRR